MTVETLSTDQIKDVALGGIVGVVVIGLIAGLVVRAIVSRIVIAVAVVVLGAFLWSQRVTVENHVRDCNSNVSFLGLHANLSQQVQARCQQLKRVPNR
jgi:hypothetical protein